MITIVDRLVMSPAQRTIEEIPRVTSEKNRTANFPYTAVNQEGKTIQWR